MATLDATVGGSAANSYETLAEALLYFETRSEVAGWENADDQEVLLMMATRVLDALAMPLRTFVPARSGMAAYYITRKAWAGASATTTQRLAWPRTGLLDMNGNSLDHVIASASVASPTVITTTAPHRLQSTQHVLIVGSNTTPTIDGDREVTVLSPTTFSIAVNVTIAGTTGNIYIIPQALKDALSELAGQLGVSDRTLDNDVIVQGIKSVRAGSVALTFSDMIETHVLPDMVWNLMPPSWFSVEVITPAWPAQFDVVS